tara:strand:- start:78 stop:467 length:390 start_codon:yes stop_codon:yes gene_type:complete
MPKRTVIVPDSLAPNPAFSPAVRVGDLLFVSGQVSVDNDGNIIGVGDCEAQARQIVSRISTIVQSVGASMSDVVKITTFLTDINDYPSFSKVRGETFPTDPPASSTVIVAGLVRPELVIEIEAVVNIPD